MKRMFVVLAVTLLVIATAQGASITIAGTANIFGANGNGGGTPAPGGGTGGTSAPFIDLSGISGPVSIQFTSPSGVVNCCVGLTGNVSADGGMFSPPLFSGNTLLNPVSSISGIQFTGRQMFMTGVFVGSSFGATPSSLSYTDTSANVASFSGILLQQLFFVGDGQYASGSQTFFIPAGATRLYLGFADGLMNGVLSDPGFYGDNAGSITIDYAIATEGGAVPEPGTVALMLLGLAGIAIRRFRR